MISILIACASTTPDLCFAAPSPRLTGFAQDALVGDGQWALLVVGISGNPELKESYFREGMRLRDVLERSLGFPRDHVITLFEDPAINPGRVEFKSTGEGLTRACSEIAVKAKPSDLVFVFIMGHGSFDKNGYKLNLVGPDPSGEDLAAAIYAIPARSFVVVNTTSASGGSLKALSRENAIVITATKSGNEKNETHLSGFFIEALENQSADLDKNGRVSVLEAFSYAARKTEEYYSKEGGLQSEHPVLDDDGDGQGQSDPGPANGEGFLARTTYLGAPPMGLTLSKLTAEEKALAAEAGALEKQIEKLKYAKATMPQDEYEKKLEELLVRLAEINAKLRKK